MNATIHAFKGIAERIDWGAWMLPCWGPMGGFAERLKGLDRNLTVAHAHPSAAVRTVRLELALLNLAGVREQADELELAITQALEQARRDSISGAA